MTVESRLAYSYPHAVGTVPHGAAEIVDTHGGMWRLATVRAVPTGLYLWGLAANPALFRTLPQIRRNFGLAPAQSDAGLRAEVAQFRSLRR